MQALVGIHPDDAGSMGRLFAYVPNNVQHNTSLLVGLASC